MGGSFFYNVPNGLLLLVILVVLVSLALICLYIFTVLETPDFNKRINNDGNNIFISIIGIAVGLVFAFITTDSRQDFNNLSGDLIEESNTIFLFIKILQALPETESFIDLSVNYLCSIINVEFPEMEQGEPVGDNQYLDSLQVAYYEYQGLVTRKDEILYEQGLTYLNQFIFLRNRRIEAASQSAIDPEFQWVLIILFVILIASTWFVLGNNIYRGIMTVLIIIVYGSLLFLTLIQNQPFRGSFGLDASPFIFVADKLGITCPTLSQTPIDMEKIKSTFQEKFDKVKVSTAPKNTEPWFRSKK